MERLPDPVSYLTVVKIFKLRVLSNPHEMSREDPEIGYELIHLLDSFLGAVSCIDVRFILMK